jgi:hypothetical protein
MSDYEITRCVAARFGDAECECPDHKTRVVELTYCDVCEDRLDYEDDIAPSPDGMTICVGCQQTMDEEAAESEAHFMAMYPGVL